MNLKQLNIEKYRLLIFPKFFPYQNSHTFVSEKRV